MSTFYLLPPRPVVAERFAEFLKTMLPGTNWSQFGMADAIESLLLDHPDVYVVWREDLPIREDVMTTLIQDYGAEGGDEVIEVRSSRGGNWDTQRWWVMTDMQGAA